MSSKATQAKGDIGNDAYFQKLLIDWQFAGKGCIGKEYTSLVNYITKRKTQVVLATEAKLDKDAIREVFTAHGFTVKPGETDLKQYVFDAANALLARASEPRAQTAVESFQQECAAVTRALDAETQARAAKPDAMDLLRKLVSSNVGERTKWQLSDGIGTDTDEGRAWAAAIALVASTPDVAQATNIAGGTHT